MNLLRRLARAILCLVLPAFGFAQSSKAEDESILEKVVVLSRHGVRSPLQSREKLAAYSRLPWPKWDVPPGDLTAHGRILMSSLGGFYAQYYGAQGLFSGQGCSRAHDSYVWSDTDERDLATASGFLQGLFPNCELPIDHIQTKDGIDPIIHPLKAHIGHPDRARASQEILDTIGGNADNVRIANMPAFLTLDRILGGCGQVQCKDEAPGRQILLGMKADIEPAEDADHLIQESKGPLGIGSTLSEILLLEYTDAKPADQLGFGQMSRADLTEVLAIHSVYFNLAQETDYSSRVQASNIMQHILTTLTPTPTSQLSEERRPASGASRPAIPGFGSANDRFVFLATHDTTIANAAGFLRIHWMMPGDQMDPTPPGGGLVFELRRDRDTGKRWVRLRFISETLDQMHETANLTLTSPPAILPIFIPGCGVTSHDNDCPFDEFARLVDERTLWEFTTP